MLGELRSGGVSSNERESSLERERKGGRSIFHQTTNWEAIGRFSPKICQASVYFGAWIMVMGTSGIICTLLSEIVSFNIETF